MENFFVFLLVLFGFVCFLIYIRVVTQDKGNTKEKIGKAVGDMALNSANQISKFANTVTETSDNRKKRIAKQALAERNSLLYNFDWYGSDDYLKRLFTIDDYLGNSLFILNISKEDWERTAKKLFYIGTIKKLNYSRLSKEKLTKQSRKSIFFDDNPRERSVGSAYLIESLDFFRIPHTEWIDYGEAVIFMHNLLDDEDIKNYGYVLKSK